MPTTRNIPELKDLINTADEQRLRIFLWKQLKRNTHLAIKLRTYLIDETESTPGTNKYSGVLGLLVAHDVHGRIRLTRRAAQLLREVCAHFTALQEEYVQAGALRDAWEAGRAVITHLHLYLDRQPVAEPKLVAILAQSYLHIQQCFALFPAPELRRDIYTTLLDLAARRHHRIYHIGHNAVTVLLYAAPDAHDLKQVREVIIGHLGDNTDTRQRTLWSALLLKTATSDDDTMSFIDPSISYDIAQTLHSTGDITGLDRFMTTCPEPVMLTPAQERQWARWRFDSALRSGDRTSMLTHGLALLHLDHDLHTYRRMRNACGGVIDLTGTQLPADLLGAIHADDANWQLLARLIEDTLSMQLLIRYLADLMLHIPDADQFITGMVSTYAHTHGGEQCTVQIRDVLHALRSGGHGAVATRIMDLLAEEFPERFEVASRPSRATSSVSNALKDGNPADV